jgi:hypothetical protein
MAKIKKYLQYLALLLLWVLSSYALTSMVSNGKIVLPHTLLDYPQPYTIATSELADNPNITLKNLEILPNGRLRTTTDKPQIEIRGLGKHLTEIRSISYKWKTMPKEDYQTIVFFAYPDGTYNAYRQIVDNIKQNDRETIIEISPWVDTGSNEQIRLDIVDKENVVLELEKITFNSQYSFNVWLFMSIILVFAGMEVVFGRE